MFLFLERANAEGRVSFLLPTTTSHWFHSRASGDLAVVLDFVGCLGRKFAADG